jgi:cephalosporin-C deacetylase
MGNVLIRGWYSVPKKQIKHPGLLRIPGHSVNILPDTTIKDFAVLALNIRGHGNSSDAIHPGFPGYITHGLQNKYSYIYRGAYMDGIRGLDFLYSQAEVDTSRIAVEGHSQGGGISIALAALDHRIKAIAPDQPFLSDFRNYFKIAPWPKSEFSAFANTHFKGAMDSVYTILSYIDIKNLAPLVHCPVIMLVGLKDETCPPEINFAAFNNISSKNKEYRIYPEAIHELPSGYYKIKMNWIRQLFKMPETVN